MSQSATTTPAGGRNAHRTRTPPPRIPRRVSGPATGRTRVAATPPAQRAAARQLRTLLRSLPDHALLDRLVRGRAWIPLLGVMLAGIVAMQVEVLKFGASIGRAIQRGSALSMQNQQLRAAVTSLADEQRVETLAARMGMVMPPPTAVGFLSVRGGIDVGRALADIKTPNATSFLSASTTNGSVVTLAAAAAAAPRPSTSATTSSSTATSSTSTGTPVGATTTTSSTTSASAAAQTATTPSATTQTATTPSSTTPSSTTPSSTPATATLPTGTTQTGG
jgi:hypothetical protein